jgi:hypothetical protein
VWLRRFAFSQSRFQRQILYRFPTPLVKLQKPLCQKLKLKHLSLPHGNKKTMLSWQALLAGAFDP